MHSRETGRGKRSVVLLAAGASLMVLAASGAAVAGDAGAKTPAPSPAPGGDAAQPPLAADQASPNTVGEIVVTAQRREQRLSDVPLSVQAVTGDALARAGVTDARAIEQISPAVSFTSGYTPTTTSLVIRGAASLANEGGIQPSVGVVINGVPAARQGEFVTDLADIDRIEVLSGPQGTLFGKNSTAGVINIVSNRPKDVFAASAEGTVTSDGERIVKAMINGPLAPGIDLRLNGYYHRIDPLISNIGGGDELGQESYGGEAKLLIDLTPKANLLLTGSYNRSVSTFGVNFVLTPSSDPLGPFQSQVFGPIGRGQTTINQDTTTYNKNHSYSLIAELNWSLTDHLKLVSISGYRDFDSKTEIDVDAGPIGYNPGRGYSPNPLGYPIQYVATNDRHQPETYQYFSQEVRLAYSANRIDAVGGVYYQTYHETRRLRLPFILDGAFATQVPSLAGVPFVNDTTLASKLDDDTVATFADVTYEVVHKIKAFGGIRYTHEEVGLNYSRLAYFNPVEGFYDPETDIDTAPPIDTLNFTDKDATRTTDDVSGRAGLQWQPTPGQNYYASYNRGYKGAAANQGRAVISAATAILQPETADAYEIGAKERLFHGALALDLAIYKQTIDNIQQTAVLPDSTVVDLVNAGNLDIKGVEFNATGRPWEGLLLNLGVVYNDATYQGNDASGRPVSFSCGPSSTPGVGRCRADDTQSLVGQQAIGSPKWKVITSATYDYKLTDNLNLSTRISYSWHSSIQYQLYEDPLTREPSVGILDLSVGLGPRDGRWQVTAFVKNLTNEFYYDNLNTSDFFIGRQFGNLPRDFARYGGLRLSYKM